MNNLIESLTTILDSWGEFTELILNGVSLVCIIIGVIISFVVSYRIRKRKPGPQPMHIFFRKMFGGWLIVALEFQLAADIIGTIIAPTTGHLIELGVIAVIRTFLNYFLNKELEETELPVGLYGEVEGEPNST